MKYVESKKIQAVIDRMRQRTVTALEVAAMCGIGGEMGGSHSYMSRRGREIISDISHRHPVISLSSQKGYRIAVKDEDVEDVLHQRKENDSRIKNIACKNSPLDKFMAKIMLKRGIANTVRLEQMLPLEKHYKDDEYHCRG